MLEATSDFVFSRQEFEGVVTALSRAHADAVIEAQGGAKTCSERFNAAKMIKHRVGRNSKMRAFAEAVESYVKAATKVGIFEGAIRENQRYIAELDKRIRAAGGSKSEEVLMEEWREKVAA
jgi:hypothetical protein